MKFNRLRILTMAALASGLFFSCAQQPKQTNQKVLKVTTQTISTKLPWSERMMQSEMKRFPEAWMLDFFKSPK